MKIDDCDKEADCVMDQKKIKKKKAKKSKVTDEENFYKCKCRDLVTDISKIRGIGDEKALLKKFAQKFAFTFLYQAYRHPLYHQ